jgi:hypothetical protein
MNEFKIVVTVPTAELNLDREEALDLGYILKRTIEKEFEKKVQEAMVPLMAQVVDALEARANVVVQHLLDQVDELEDGALEEWVKRGWA